MWRIGPFTFLRDTTHSYFTYNFGFARGILEMCRTCKPRCFIRLTVPKKED